MARPCGLILLLLSACADDQTRLERIKAGEPLRIASTPFYFADESLVRGLERHIVSAYAAARLMPRASGGRWARPETAREVGRHSHRRTGRQRQPRDCRPAKADRRQAVVVMETSEAFIEVLQNKDIQISMNGKGRWLNNVFIERLWRSVKYEEVDLKAYTGVANARRSLACYFRFYNPHRRHQALDAQTPDGVYYQAARVRAA